MIQILGIKRILVLLFLVSINAALATGVYVYLAPEIKSSERSLRSLRGKITTLQTDISRLQVEFDQLEEQQETFEELKKAGFFSNQDRRQAELIFKDIQEKTGVISAVASIKPGELEENEEAKKADHSILTSPVELTLQAIDDVDVYKYVYLVERFFPGHVSINSIELGRTTDITGTVLRSIASGNRPVLVEAKISMNWSTMIPDEDVIQLPGGAL